MLKKIIIGFLCLIFLAVVGLGIYIYMLDWNQHKKLVEERFSQITGLRAVIDGDLAVELFPSPKFTANRVKFLANTGGVEPLVQVNSISANVDFMAMLHQKFILSSMTLTGATVNYIINEKGESNWKNFGISANNRSGNVEVSFKDVRLSSSLFNYKNLQNDKHFEIPNISGFVSAPSLKGPYNLNIQFIHNESEIKIGGTVVKNNDIILDLIAENAATASKLALKGSLSNGAKGNLSLSTANLTALSTIIFGSEIIPTHYNDSFYLSFQYDRNPDAIKLDNFNVAYGNSTKGNGTTLLDFSKEKPRFVTAMNMSTINLDILENICADIISSINKKSSDFSSILAGYSANINIKSDRGLYKNAEIQNINLALGLENNILSFHKFNAVLPGNTSVKVTGQVDFSNVFDYSFNNVLETDDLRTFASVFGLDLSKLATEENKKTIFKKANTSFVLSGNLQNLKLNIAQAFIDAVELRGNMGFIFDKDKTFVIADINSSQILFDKYMEPLPAAMERASLEEKIVHQLNLIPLKHDLDIDAHILISSAVYNSVPLQKVSLEAKLSADKLNIKDLSVENIAGAALQMQLEAQNIYVSPYFKELSYNVKTNNFPAFASALGITLGKQKLFQRKLFASQGALSGSIKDFNLSSVQKFGDMEFAYTGTVTKNKDQTVIDGDLELKANNFTNMIAALNLDYVPDIPVTSFSLSGKVSGSTNDFTLDDLTAYLGANNIRGSLRFSNSLEKPTLTAKLDFDKFDADRYLNLSKLQIITPAEEKTHTFIVKPDILADKIDYSSLKKINYNISSTAQQLVYHNKTYTSAAFESNLNDGLLQVSKFNIKNDESAIDLTFMLNVNNVPEIEGDYNVQSFLLPTLGGTIYEIQSGRLNTTGHFKSIIPSAKDFFENLSAKGNFVVTSTAIKGWDLDLIKFELEQRKTTEGLESNILNDLKNGSSPFAKISGDFTISNGVLITDNTLLESPVANLSMSLDLNLSNWLFTANFDTIYRNASFSDVLKYTFDGNLANPTVSADLSESLKRIGETESMIEEAKEKQAKVQKQKLSDKIDNINRQIDAELKNVSQMNQYISKYKPQTVRTDIHDTYNNNLKDIADVEQTLSRMADTMNNNPQEKDLMEIEAQLSTIRSKLSFIPKSLEDNFILDSKYIFEDLFDKIAWVYDVASHNASYYTSLSDAYLAQIKLLQNSENSLSEDVVYSLKEGKEIVAVDMEKIRTLHSKMRENYVNIVETNSVSEMKEKNQLTTQALQTLIAYTERMNKQILSSLRKFRSALDLSADDDEHYIIFPPHEIDAIDTQQPTTMIPSLNNKIKKNETKKNNLLPLKNVARKKKEQTAFLTLPEINKGLSELIQESKISHIISAENPIAIEGVSTNISSVVQDLSLDTQEKIIVADANTHKESSISVSNEQPQDFTLLKQAQETIHTILTGPSAVKSSSILAFEPLFTDFPAEKKAFTANTLISSSKNNTDGDTHDLNLKSGFKKSIRGLKAVVNQQGNDFNSSFSIEPEVALNFDNSPYLSTLLFEQRDQPINIKSDSTLITDHITKRPISFSGNIGKSMLRYHTTDIPQYIYPIEKYLFVSSDTFLPFSGYIAKNMSLSVK